VNAGQVPRHLACIHPAFPGDAAGGAQKSGKTSILKSPVAHSSAINIFVSDRQARKLKSPSSVIPLTALSTRGTEEVVVG
jgi:hypothetical protein